MLHLKADFYLCGSDCNEMQAGLIAKPVVQTEHFLEHPSRLQFFIEVSISLTTFLEILWLTVKTSTARAAGQSRFPKTSSASR